MKTPISHINRLLPVILVILFLTFAAAAQTGSFPAMSAETPPAVVSPYTLNPGGLQEIPNFSNAKSLFNIKRRRLSMPPGINNYFAGNGAGADPGNTGSWNSFVGSEAGFSNKWGSANSFFGYQAGYKNLGNGISDAQLGYYNSFFGYQAGFSNETGRDNSFFGSGAGMNSKGSSNSFFGSGAGANNEVGLNNVFMGAGAGYNSKTNSGNSFVGFQAGINHQTGGVNSFFGYLAGYNNKTGSNNTLIGASADVGSSQLTYATAIGSGAIVDKSNTIVLGRSNTLDNVVIPGRLLLNKLGAGGARQIQLCLNAYFISNCQSSSLRYKTNVVSFSSGLDLVRRLRPIRFEWKEGGMKDVGFGAEDVAAVEPLLATYNEKGEVEGVKYDRISTVLVNAVKEQQAQIEAQQQQLKQQQAAIEGLKKLLCGQNPDAGICKQ